mmetsp:Transcript_33584/g.56189  ORF Transcript_33584/g.56189 Transcript_33584/m.56189 type:complete len:224 (-) Transcript_33584:105-776(-)
MIVPPMSFEVVTSTQREGSKQQSAMKIKSAMKGTRRRRDGDRFVTFVQSVDVKEVPHLKDLPQEEKNATWYTNADFEVIKRSIILTLRLMVAKKPVGSDQCTRGLEFRTPGGAKFRKQNKLEALTAVWNEQVAQWKDNVTDEEAIRRVYLEQSLKCRETAIKFGLHDENAVRHYLRNEEEEDEDDSSNGVALEETGLEDSEKQTTDTNIEAIVVKQSCVPSAA